MPVLFLDQTQRINMHALIGAQRANVDDMRIFWRIQDRLELSPEEKELIGYHLRDVNGQSQIAWETSHRLEPKELEITEDECKKLANIVKTWQPGYTTGPDRQWLEPLLEQLENGSGIAAQAAAPR